MTSFLKKTTLSAALLATAITGMTATPALADGYRGGRGHGDGTGTAIAAGIFGLALGAIIVSSANNNHRDHDGPYVGGYYRPGWAWRDGYYWDRDGRRYDRDGRNCDEDGYARRGYIENYRGEVGRGEAYRGGYNQGYQGGGYNQGYRGQGYSGGYSQGYNGDTNPEAYNHRPHY